MNPNNRFTCIIRTSGTSNMLPIFCANDPCYSSLAPQSCLHHSYRSSTMYRLPDSIIDDSADNITRNSAYSLTHSFGGPRFKNIRATVQALTYVPFLANVRAIPSHYVLKGHLIVEAIFSLLQKASSYTKLSGLAVWQMSFGAVIREENAKLIGSGTLEYLFYELCHLCNCFN